MAKKRKKHKPRSVGNKTGKNSLGQFVKGNKCSVGNKGNTSERAKTLKRVLLEVVTEKDIEVIVKKMIAQAKKGERDARKELFDRLWGRAIQEVDLGEETRKTMFDILAVCGLSGDNGD